MSEPENNLAFPTFGEENLDIAAIFGAQTTDVNPFAPPVAQTPIPVAVTAPVIPTANTQPVPTIAAALPEPVFAPAEPASQNPLELAFTEQAKATVTKTTQSLFEKLPVFSYGGAGEPIEDASLTFEELRIVKADDFPELTEGKKVTWTLEYGKTTKTIPDPKGTTIASVKTEIEQSKAFLEGLKKAKEHNPDCLVKPHVTAQSKGVVSYKGVFDNLGDARKSDKVICLIPARDGKIYEMRKNELGEFTAPTSNVTDFSEIRAGFIPALPPIPHAMLQQVISFFRHFMAEDGLYEALVHIYWDRELQKYAVFIPKQEVYHCLVQADMCEGTPPEDRYLHYADIHSHNSMSAKFSLADDADEKATRLYLVVGRLHHFYPMVKARISCGGIFHEIDPTLVLEGAHTDFPQKWLEPVTRRALASEPFGTPPQSFGRYQVK